MVLTTVFCFGLNIVLLEVIRLGEVGEVLQTEYCLRNGFANWMIVIHPHPNCYFMVQLILLTGLFIVADAFSAIF